MPSPNPSAVRYSCSYQGLFSRFAAPNGEFCLVEQLSGHNCSVTVVEQGIAGKELAVINVCRLAEMLAAMHTVSLRRNCQIQLNTIWDLFDLETDIVQGYRLFGRLFAKYFSEPRINWTRWHQEDYQGAGGYLAVIDVSYALDVPSFRKDEISEHFYQRRH